MPTTVTRYINWASTDGGDGTTNDTTGPNRAFQNWSTWAAARARDLVAADEIELVMCDHGGAQPTFGSARVQDIHISTAGGWTCDATRYVRFQVQDSARDTGVLGSGYYITNYNAANLRVEAGGHCQCDGITFRKQSSGVGVYQIQVNSTGVLLLERCVFDGASSGGAFVAGLYTYSMTDGQLEMRNTRFYDYGSHFMRYNGGGGSGEVRFLNCSIHNVAFQDGQSGMQLDGTAPGGRVIFHNTIVDSPSLGSGSECFNSTGLVGSFNVSSDATAPGTNASTGVSPLWVATNNLDLQSGDTVAKNAGTDLSSTYNFSNDFYGDTRPKGASWDRGSHEEGVGGTPPTVDAGGPYSGDVNSAIQLSGTVTG